MLPSVEPVTLNLYLYYDGKNQENLDEFFEIDRNSYQEDVIIYGNEESGQTDYVEYRPKADLYMFFTTEDHCNEYKSHRPLEILAKIGWYFILFQK